MMDYPCAKFDDCTFSPFSFIVRASRDRQTDRQTKSHTDTDKRYTNAPPVGVSKAWFSLAKLTGRQLG